MTIEEFKNLLLTDTEDKAGVIDSAVGAFSDAMYKIEDLERELDNARGDLEKAQTTINEMTDTNLKLLEKVKYSDDAAGDDGEPEEINDTDITIEDLFKEED